jgi:hypothetical protein
MPTVAVDLDADPSPSIQAFADGAGALRDAPTALVIDLDPIVGVRVAAHLSARRLASVVLVLPRWPHAEAVLPTHELTRALVDESRRVRPSPARHVAFVLDGERSRPVRRAAIESRVDNRYDLSVGDLPNLRQLHAAGIAHVVKLSHHQ